jgi:hypothetical protein
MACFKAFAAFNAPVRHRATSRAGADLPRIASVCAD